MVHKRIGEIHQTTKAEKFTIIEYFSNTNITIQFNDGTIVYGKHYNSIKSGKVTNPNFKLFFGIGFIGIGKYSQTTHLKIYQIWKSMLFRCYDTKYQIKFPTYIGCTVDKSWYNFQTFAEWCEQNYVENYELDKDILIKGNKIYSPNLCCFVPHEINSLFIKSNNIRGDLPIGVSKSQNKYKVRLMKYGQLIQYNGFKTPNEAFEKYKIEKESYIKVMAHLKKDKIPDIVYQAMINYKVEITD